MNHEVKGSSGKDLVEKKRLDCGRESIKNVLR